MVLGDPLVEQFQHPFGGADDVVVGEDVLVDLRTVDIDLDDLRLAGKGGRVQSHPVREAAAHGDEQVALVTGGVGGLGAVHPHHAGGEGVRTGEAAAPHDGDGHGAVQLLGKLPELPVRPPADHAAAAHEQRPLGLGDHLHQLVDIPQVRLRRLEAVAQVQLPDAAAGAVLLPGDELIVDHSGGEGDVLQKVDEHRAGPASGSHGKGLTHHVGDGLGVPDQIGGLGDGHGDAGDVHLLESVLAQGLLSDIAGDEDHRRGIHIGGGDAGGEIGGPGARGSEAHPHLAGGSGIAIGGVGGPLLVGGQYVVYFILVVIQFIIEIQDGPARIAEDGVHLLLQQALQDGLVGS